MLISSSLQVPRYLKILLSSLLEQEKKLIDGKKIDRFIFEGDTQYDDMENKLLDQLETEFKKQAINLPPE